MISLGKQRREIDRSASGQSPVLGRDGVDSREHLGLLGGRASICRDVYVQLLGLVLAYLLQTLRDTNLYL